MEDGIAEITARYHGWKSCSYADLPVLHHRELGTVERSVYEARFKSGVTEYMVGFRFPYHLLRAFSRVFERPYVVGTALILAGYTWALLSRQPKSCQMKSPGSSVANNWSDLLRVSEGGNSRMQHVMRFGLAVEDFESPLCLRSSTTGRRRANQLVPFHHTEPACRHQRCHAG